jgi:hypothetical protein
LVVFVPPEHPNDTFLLGLPQGVPGPMLTADVVDQQYRIWLGELAHVDNVTIRAIRAVISIYQQNVANAAAL